MKLIILENNLRERLGHFLNSTIGLTNEAKRSPRISEVRVFCHKRASQEVRRLAAAKPLFRHVSWHRKSYLSPSASMQRIGEVYSHECRRIGDVAANDIILVPTAQENQVFGLGMFLASLPVQARPRAVLNFHVDNWTENAQRSIAIRDAFRALDKIGSGKVIVTAPTPELVNKLSKICGDIPARLYPLPQNYDLCVPDQTSYETAIDPIVAVMGRPIKRKGSADIANVILQVRKQSPKARFYVQCTATSPGVLRMFGSPNVRIKIGGLSPQDYGRAICMANVVLMPYTTDAYKYRTSGIFADCAAYGKVAVVPDGTWMARQIENKHAAGVIYRTAMVSSISEAVLDAIDNLENLQNNAEDRSSYWWKQQSASAYVKRLFSDIDTRDRIMRIAPAFQTDEEAIREAPAPRAARS